MSHRRFLEKLLERLNMLDCKSRPYTDDGEMFSYITKYRQPHLSDCMSGPDQSFVQTKLSQYMSKLPDIQ